MAVIAITTTMMIVEIGLAFASMALLADGLHMASHTVALGITAFEYIYARRHAYDAAYSFGTGKVNALGGFTGAVLLAAFAILMAAGSVDRLIDPAHIAIDYAILVAAVGLASPTSTSGRSVRASMPPRSASWRVRPAAQTTTKRECPRASAWSTSLSRRTSA